MFVKQISVFLENTKGGLNKLLQVVGRAGIDLYALSIADTEQFGIMRCVASDTERAMAVIRGAGYLARLNDVLAVSVDNRPGGLSRVLSLLDEANISVEYIYSFARSVGENALIIVRTDDDAATARVLADAGVALVSQAEVAAL